MLQARPAEESPPPRRATLFCDLPEFVAELRQPRREPELDTMAGLALSIAPDQTALRSDASGASA
jgi:hypothetical protein